MRCAPRRLAWPAAPACAPFCVWDRSMLSSGSHCESMRSGSNDCSTSLKITSLARYHGRLQRAATFGLDDAESANCSRSCTGTRLIQASRRLRVRAAGLVLHKCRSHHRSRRQQHLTCNKCCLPPLRVHMQSHAAHQVMNSFNGTPRLRQTGHSEHCSAHR